MDALAFVLYAIVAFFAIGTILSGFFQVRTAEAVVIQRMGKFLRVANAGINFKCPGSTRSLAASTCVCSSLLSTKDQNQRQRLR